MARVVLEPGDHIEQGQPLFTIRATPLDPRSRAQAEAMLARAKAALEAARTQAEAEQARLDLAQAELERAERLIQSNNISREQLDQARMQARRGKADYRSAQFATDVAAHEVENAQAALALAGGETQAVTVSSPVNGVVLARARESEGPIQAGEPVLNVGNLDSLEVEVDVLSPDAVRIKAGMTVELERWGGDEILKGRVQRVEPAGFTKFSALGVEEQRVWVIVDISAPREEWRDLGDGYRVEARFILWSGDSVLQVPAGALFREGDQWFAYVIEDGVAVRRKIVPGRRSGLTMEIREGLEAGEKVVLHPGENVREGSRLELRS